MYMYLRRGGPRLGLSRICAFGNAGAAGHGQRADAAERAPHGEVGVSRRAPNLEREGQRDEFGQQQRNCTTSSSDLDECILRILHACMAGCTAGQELTLRAKRPTMNMK